MELKSSKYLIVGQGIAGLSLAFRMLQRGITFQVIDSPKRKASSSVAAGIINPITGRRYVKSWIIEHLISEANSFYAELTQLIGQDTFIKKDIIRSLFNHQEEQDWWLRRQDPMYADFMSAPESIADFPAGFRPVYAFGKVEHGGRVDLRGTVEAFQAYLKRKNLFVQDTLEYEDLVLQGNGVLWKNNHFDRVVFCEGAFVVDNPFFGDLPFNPTKGEVLIIRAAGLDQSFILKNRIFLVPLGDHMFWVGSQYSTQFKDDNPEEDSKLFLLERLQEVIDCPFELLDHRAAIRPTVKDRKPMLGQHTLHKELFIFNGLGTKGASLAPYFSKHFMEYLEQGASLMPEVNIERFN